MSIWSARFGQEGVNLAVDNSFRLQVENNSRSAFTLNLFNLGGNANTQTPISAAPLGSVTSFQINSIDFGVVTAPFTFKINQGVTNLVTIGFVIGQTLNDIIAAVNPVVNLQGQSGIFSIQQAVGDITGKFYDIVISTPSVTSIDFGADTCFPTYQGAFFATNNPFVTFRANRNQGINFIQNSEIGNAYKVTGMDVYSEVPSQVLEPLNYFYRDANGNIKGALAAPTLNPYQPSRASLQMIYVDDFQIFTNTQFQYVIQALTSVYLTFTYVNFGVEDLIEFNQIFYQQVRDKYLMDKKLIQQSRLKSMNVE